MKNFINVFLVLLIIGNIGLLAGPFDVSNEKGSTSYGFTTITGKVRNNSGSNCDLFSISYKLLNRSGEIVGQAADTISNFGPGQVWSFKAIGAGDGTKTFSFDTVNCL